jgi:hypothetical protein
VTDPSEESTTATRPQLQPPTGPGTRVTAVTAAILAFFASMWFGWAQERPPAWLIPPLVAGSVVSVIILVVAVVTVFRSSGPLPAADSPEIRRRYGLTVGVESAVVGLGSIVLAVAHQPQWIGVWICAVVGLHFWPMSVVLGRRSLAYLGVVLVAVAGLAVVAGLWSSIAPVTVTGAGAGLSLATYAGVLLIRTPKRAGLRTGREEPVVA